MRKYFTLSHIAISLGVINLIAIGYLISTQPKIETLDLSLLIKRYVATLVTQGNQLSDKQAQAKMANFNQSLTYAIASMSARDNAVIMPSAAIYAGSDDKTEIVWNRVIGDINEKH
ncbi:MAG: hypothetical protein CMF49_07215 [Legionellales bacterium]|nr:hypothetical protein [Legionellales bacterium]|tara:strand:+ start:1040 stop:1387 length:348 start_codon:yes stop_codon:yes gene_type:complete